MDAADVKKTEHKAVTIDEAITIIGEYGRFQIVANVIFCFMALPPVYQIMMMFFAADSPDWKCSANSTKCNSTETFSPKNKLRCSLSRGDWEFTKPREYSMVTQFDIYCSNEWILEIMVSIFFLGWILGAIVLGWVSDNYGRKIVIFVSVAVILIVGFISCFLPSIYAFIFCRFIIGVFTPGTYQQMIMIMTEIVGPKYRAFAGNIIFVFVTTAMAILGLKAYFIREWKMLFIVCTAPYLIVLLFYKFVPDSLRTLSVNGKQKELMNTLHRMAIFNGRKLPTNTSVIMEESSGPDHNSNPLDLFKSRKLAKKTLCQSMGYIVGGMTFYGLYLAAKDIGGSMYRDFTIVTMAEIPFALITVPLCDRFGRKKTCIFFYTIGTLSCFALCFAPEHGKAKILRILLGMLGKCSIGGGYNALQTWTMELYPTYIRGEAMGFLQVLTRLGAALAPFVDQEFLKLNRSASFIFFGCITFVSIILLPPLKETKGEHMGETEVEPESTLDDKEELELKDKVGMFELNGNVHTNAAINKLYNEFHPTEKPMSTFDAYESYTNCVDLNDEAHTNICDQTGKPYTNHETPNV